MAVFPRLSAVYIVVDMISTCYVIYDCVVIVSVRGEMLRDAPDGATVYTHTSVLTPGQGSVVKM